MQAAQEWG